MAPERRNQIVLAVLVTVLLGALYRAVNESSPVPAKSAATASAATGRGRAGAVKAVEAPDVRLEALDAAKPKPSGGGRNPFEYGAQRAAAVAAGPPGPRLPPPPPALPAGPVAASVPPITLKFIGVVEATEKSQTYAVLRDDRGVYHGREGDIVEGRYRILRIGTESIELAYVDGRGRQTIRLGS